MASEQSVGAVIKYKSPDSKIAEFLLLRNRRGFWGFPQGHKERGETELQTLVREVMEETAHRFEPTGLVGIYRWTIPAKETTFLRFCFRGNVGTAEDRPLDKEIVRLHWLTAAEVKARQAQHRSPLVQRCVEDFLAGRSFPLELFPGDFA